MQLPKIQPTHSKTVQTDDVKKIIIVNNFF
jgi:hypothetical protein